MQRFQHTSDVKPKSKFSWVPLLALWIPLVLAPLFGRPFASIPGGWGFTETVLGIFFVTIAGLLALKLDIAVSRAPVISDADRELWKSLGWGGAFFTLVVFAPLAEEFIFRYLLVGALYDWSPFWAMTVSGILFGMAHSYYLFAKMVKGVGYAWLYMNSGTLLAPMAAHALWNFGAMLRAKHLQDRSLMRF